MSDVQQSAPKFEFGPNGVGLNVLEMPPHELFVLHRVSALAMKAVDSGVAPRDPVVREFTEALTGALVQASLENPGRVYGLATSYTAPDQPPGEQLFGVKLFELFHTSWLNCEPVNLDVGHVLAGVPSTWGRLSRTLTNPQVRAGAYESLQAVASLYDRVSLDQGELAPAAVALARVEENWHTA